MKIFDLWDIAKCRLVYKDNGFGYLAVSIFRVYIVYGQHIQYVTYYFDICSRVLMDPYVRIV